MCTAGVPACPNRGVNDVATGQTTHTHPNFDAPIEVVADPSLSKQEKAEALEDLEQDARQLAIAFGEGMSGGEPDGACRSAPCERGAGAPLYGFRL
jgi:hypothetical protein